MAESLSSQQPHGQGARDAYNKALKTFEESLSAKEYAKITVPKSLEDVIQTASAIQERHKTSKTRRLCDALKSTQDRLEHFNTLLRNALKVVKGGEFLWATVNFVFVVASDSAETFSKLLEVLVTTSEKMPQFTILADTFEDSTLVLDSVESLYVAIIGFWVSAAKFYRKKRLWRLSLWNDYEIHFSDLVKELDNQEQRLRDTAQVQHMQEAKEAREESRRFRRQTTFGRSAANKFAKWLSPADIYEPNFYEVDFEKANKKRHKGTCEWILRKDLYKTWESIPDVHGALLVIYGIPGAGKTILSSFLVHHCIHRVTSGSRHIGLYFFFDNKDEHKRSPLAVARSLVYQLFSTLTSRKQDKIIQHELGMRMQTSATDRAMNYDSLWATFKSVIQQENIEILIVLDAMDECNGSKTFIRDLKILVATSPVHIIVTSRSETSTVRVFAEGQGVPAFYVTTDDVKRDIISYIQAKVEKSASLQHPQVKDSVVTALATKSGGMFLWVFLMLKVLKSLPTVFDILQALSALPEKLDDVYERILKHLYESLKPGPRAFCQLILKWIVATSRPLLFTELVEGLKAEYNKTSSMFDHERGFQNTLLYGRKDIELVCGSLVTVNQDSIRLIHLSTRDYLRSSTEAIGLEPPLDGFLVDVSLTQNNIALTCLEYLSSQSVTETPNLTPTIDTSSLARRGEIADIIDRNPLFEYAVQYWPNYISNNVNSGTAEAMRQVECFLHRTSAITWLEAYLFFSGPEYTASTVRRLSKVEGAPPGIIHWADSLIDVLNEYATTMTKEPWMIHKCFRPRHIEQHILSNLPNIQIVVRLPFESDLTSRTPKRSLTEVGKGAKSWVHLDPRSKTIFMTQVTHSSMRLASQNSEDGVRYRPAIDAEEESPNGEWGVRSVATRPGGSHIAVTFCPPGRNGVSAESFYRTVVWLIKDPSKQTGTDDWAERVLIDRTESSIFRCAVLDSYQSEGRGSVVSFAGNGTLITPGGIYNIFTEDKLNSPPQIFHPSARITGTSFNGHRVTRIRDLTELEVLSLDGHLIRTFSFRGSEVLQVCTVGYTGQKIVVTYSDVTAKRDLRRIQCVHVDSGNVVRLQSRGVSRINFPRFTASEDRLVGRISSNPDHSGSEIAIWNVDSGHVAYLFKDPEPQLSFCLNMDDTHVMIISPSGELILRNVDEEWNLKEEAEFLSHHTSKPGWEAARSLWQVIGSNEICKLSFVRRHMSDDVSSDARDQKKHFNFNLIMSKMSQALHGRQASSSPNKIYLEKEAWRFNTDDIVSHQICLEGRVEAKLAISSEGNLIAASSKYVYASEGGLRQIHPPKQKGHPQGVYLSPKGRYILTVEETSDRRLIQACRISDDFSRLVSCGSYRLEGHVMDLNIGFHHTAPVFAVSYTSMSLYSSSMVCGETLIGVISEEDVQVQTISGTFHPSFGFSHCGEYFFGTTSMEEADEAEIYDEPESDEDGLSELNNDDLPVNSDSRDYGLDQLSFRQSSSLSNKANDPEEARSSYKNAIRPEMDSDSLQESPSYSSSPGGNLDTASGAGTKKYPWPKLYKLPSELQYPVAEGQQEAIKFKLGSFYVRALYMCRLRLSETMGILYLDKMQSDDSAKLRSLNLYRSRVLCIVPDAFLDLLTTEIFLVWPQQDSESATSTSQQFTKDLTVKVVLFPSGRSNVPLLINTGLEGPALLNF